LLINDILDRVNRKLAGEILSYDDIQIHLDSVIDDINAKLSSKFPAFSEFIQPTYAQYPNYNFFPDKYIRSVVCLGAAYYFYQTDEEGATSAIEYQKTYANNLFLMQRDYSSLVPVEYQDQEQGYMDDPDPYPEDIVQSIWGDI
jgi:hypothetical protein